MTGSKDLDMAINTKKTCCLRIGPRANISCTPIHTLSGISLQWFDEIRYLGVHIIDLLVLKFPWIGLNVRFIVLQTVFSAKLDGLLRKKL